MKICSKCVLPESYPGIEFDESGVCNYCRNFSLASNTADKSDFSDEQELAECLHKFINPNRKYDVLVPISGGVDSSFALINIVKKYNLRPLAFHNDNGFEDDIATENVRKLCKYLGVDLVLLQHDHNFMKKLWKYTNQSYVHGLTSCYICGNILYLNAIELAKKYGIPLVINGYSKGQAALIDDMSSGVDLFEKLLDIIKNTNDNEFFLQFIEKYKVLEIRDSYKCKGDLEKVNEDRVLVIPFFVFKFYKTDKKALREEITKLFDWSPMKNSYPGRTTNCQMVWLNTYMDLLKMSFSAYHIEYSELIRKGEITREQALKDLELIPPEGLLEQLARDIDFDLERYSDKSVFCCQDTKKQEIDIDFEL